MVVGFISFGVWVHHMFATGIPALALSFFSAASLIITIPSGVQFFAWIATMWKGVVRFTTPMLFAIGFLLIFLLGGITGVMVAVLPFDWQVTDSYFVVAHFHYVLNGAVVFPIFGALYFWLPKMTGKMLSEQLGKISFWTMFIGFNVTFFPMHILGFLGMPRRVYTYESDLGWDGLNLVISIAAFFFAFGTLLTLWNFIWSQFRGAPAPDDPWDGDSLEWTTTSPPPEYNFALAPVVNSRHPLWDEPQPLPVAAPGADRATRALGVEGALEKEMPITEGLDALPQDTLGIPQPTYLPFVVAIGIAVVLRRLVGRSGDRRCHRPRVRRRRPDALALADRGGPPMTQAVAPVVPVVPVETAPVTRGYPTAWWGMVVLITTEAMIFLVLLSAYFFVRSSSTTWPLGGIEAPELTRSSIFTVVLLASSIPIFWMEHALVARPHAAGGSGPAHQLPDGCRVPREHRIRLLRDGLRLAGQHLRVPLLCDPRPARVARRWPVCS